MYVKDDPRSALASAKSAAGKREHKEYFGSQVGLFYDTEPQIESEKARTWVTRGQNFCVVYSECEEGACLTRDDQPDEYAVIVPEKETSVRLTAGGESVDVPGYSVVFVPPGKSEIEVTGKGRLVRFFTPKSKDWADLSSNAAAYGGEHPNVPPFEPWPDPLDGFKVRWYSLEVPEDSKRFGRIFRCTTFMINYLNPRVGPRERDAVSPHHHDDFEQCSLALSGEFTHHIRWPWTTDMNKWKEDEHLLVKAPSICVIPPPAIHTSTSEAQGVNQLVDIFSPPRVDFSLKPGWVLNADDYPLKEGLES